MMGMDWYAFISAETLAVLGRDFGGVYNYLSVEDFLLDTLVEVVGDGSDKHALCEIGDFGSRNKTIELRGDGGRLVIELDSDEPTV